MSAMTSMSYGTSKLPEFTNPPITEVVLSVGFEPVDSLTNVKLMDLWRDLFRTEFQSAEEKPPYFMPLERFDRRVSSSVQLFTGQGPPPARFWLIKPSGTELIQIQNNWFARNWRKQRTGDEYPRYEEHIRPEFKKDLGRFATYVEESGLGKVVPKQCEVTYINHISPSTLWSTHQEFEKVFGKMPMRPGTLGSPESVAFQVTHVMRGRNDDDSPVGRLYSSLDSVYREPEGTPIFRLNLTARGAPFGEALDEVLAFMDTGRLWVIDAFMSWTSPEAQQEWGLVK